MTRTVIRPLANGMLTGLFLQLALGPVFFFIVNISISSNLSHAFWAVIAVTLADYIYIILALLGIGQVLKKAQPKLWFGRISSCVLAVFGMMILIACLNTSQPTDQILPVSWTGHKAFSAAFVLTLSSPLTIVFWSSIFSAKAIEKNYQAGQLTWFSLGTGLSTFLFLSASILVLSIVKTQIPIGLVRWLNGLVGGVLILYGIRQGIPLCSKRQDS